MQVVPCRRSGSCNFFYNLRKCPCARYLSSAVEIPERKSHYLHIIYNIDFINVRNNDCHICNKSRKKTNICYFVMREIRRKDAGCDFMKFCRPCPPTESRSCNLDIALRNLPPLIVRPPTDLELYLRTLPVALDVVKRRKKRPLERSSDSLISFKPIPIY